jgi:mRNA interferase HigB
MHVVAGKYLKETVDQFPAAAKQIAAWRSVAKDAQWLSPAAVKNNFADVDFVGDYVVFRIHRSLYRLVTTIHYARRENGRTAEGHIWVRSFLTNKQYENTANWDKGVLPR